MIHALPLQKLGSINCYIDSTVKLGKESVRFNGTTKDMVRKLVERFGASRVSNAEVVDGDGMRFRIVPAPHDNRAYGFWADRIWGENL